MGVLVLGLLAVAVCAAFIGLFALMVIVKLFLRILLLPLLLLKWIVGAVLFLLVAPVLFVAGLLIALVLGVALFVPLLPFIAVAFLVWLLVRANRRPALA
jgi:hypothetical protein